MVHGKELPWIKNNEARENLSTWKGFLPLGWNFRPQPQYANVIPTDPTRSLENSPSPRPPAALT